MSKVMLEAVPTAHTGRPGCIGFKVAEGEPPIAGFASVVEVDPNGLFAAPEECDRLAAEVVKRWNSHEAMLAALKEAAALFRTYEESHRAKRPVTPDTMTKAERNRDIATRLEAIIAKAEGLS